jgi:hypothetical protein
MSKQKVNADIRAKTGVKYSAKVKAMMSMDIEPIIRMAFTKSDNFVRSTSK